MRSELLPAATVCAALFALAPVVSGQVESPASTTADRARDRFVSGTALAREGKWADALAAFEEAAALRPHAVTTYDIAYCERALGHRTRAWRSFLRALDQHEEGGGTALDDELRRGAEEYAKELDAELARAVVTLEPGDAAVSVDGRPMEVLSSDPTPVLVAGTRSPGPPERVPAATFELRLDPGPHRFLVQTGTKSRSVETRVQAGASFRLSVSIEPPPPPSAAVTAAARARTEGAHGGARQRAGALVVGGLGLGALGAAAVLGGMAASRWSDAKEACPALTTCRDDTGHDRAEEAHRLGNVATVASVAGALGVACGAALWLTAPIAPKAAQGARARGPLDAVTLTYNRRW